MNAAPQKGRTGQRVLLAIASFGEGNLHFLQGIIQSYKSMAFDFDIVIHSNVPKNPGPGIKVVVGLPSENPHSLPFAHKALFAENVDHYDLFIYSEDDIGVSETNLRAFIQATPVLAQDEIAGFLRQEVDGAGTRSFLEAHACYHWKPESVRREGAYTTAEFTNEHVGFYVLTQEQLRRAIASGGYLRAPYAGRYGMLETAATDPYTNCGFRKVICVSHLDDFLVHHLPNRYVGKLGIPMSDLEAQVERLLNIGSGIVPGTRLGEVESRLPGEYGWKGFYENPTPELLDMMPAGASTILSIGCGWGATEACLQARGAKVTALPLDSVIGAVAERRGISVVYGTWDECMERLDARQFDYVLMDNLLHLQPDPKRLLAQCCRLVAKRGSLVLTGPNFTLLKSLINAARGFGVTVTRRSLKQAGISVRGPHSVIGAIEKAGLKVAAVRWVDARPAQGVTRVFRRAFPTATAPVWMLQATRP